MWRIPGTPNWPNAKKVGAGRPQHPQRVRIAQPCTEELVAVADIALPGPEPEFTVRPNGPDKSASIDEVLELLPAELCARIKGPITGDRSTNLMAVIAELCRRDFDDATIERIIRAFPNGVGAKYVGRRDLGGEIARVRAKTAANRKLRGKPARYDDEVSPHELAAERARSQRRLKELIADFNRRYAVVNESGKVWVFQWRLDPVLKREVLDRISFADFRRMYENRRLSVITDEGKVNKTLADWWLAHPARRQYLAGVTFDPTGQALPEYWNLWRGFAVAPRPGDWSLMRAHIEKIICSGIAEHACYVLDWLARLFQHPNRQGEVALVLRGLKGVGKGIVGQHYS